MTTPDFHALDCGSLIALRPQTDAAHLWVAEHLPEDAQWFAGAVAIEPRYFAAIYDGARADGLTFNL